MAKGINIPIASETREFASGIKKGVIEPLDDAQKALDDLGRNDGPGDLENGMRDAQRRTEDTRDEVRDLTDAVKQSGRAGRDMGDDYRQGTRDAEDGLGEFKDEANSTAREAAASFDGSAESIGDAFQEVAANAFAGFGPAGAIAGVAAAAGLGLAFAAIEQGSESTEQYKQRVADLADQFIETGGTGERSMEDIVDQLRTMATETDDNATKLEDLRYISEKLDEPLSEIADAYTRGGRPLEQLIERTAELASAEQSRVNELAGAMGVYHSDELGRLQNLTDALSQQQEAIEQAQQAEMDYLASGASEYEAKRSLIKTVNDAYDDAAGAASGFLDRESGIFDTAGYIGAMEERKVALQTYQEQVWQSGLSTDSIEFLNSQGYEAAASMFAGYQSASDAEKGKLNSIWTEAGRENSGAYAESLNGTLPKTVQGPTIETTAETREAEAQIQDVAEERYEAEIKTKADTKDAESAIDRAADRRRTATIDVRGDFRQFDSDLDSRLNRRRTVYVDVVERPGSPTRSVP